MTSRNIIISGLLMLTVQSAQAGLTVHEWGTFTSLVGSDGKTQNGMYHEDEALPEFVHKFGDILEDLGSLSFLFEGRRCPPNTKSCIPAEFINNNVISQKMETPVLYFYSEGYQKLSVNVKFPEGIISESYPAPVSTFPMRSDAPVVANGNTTYEIEVLDHKNDKLPYVDPTNIYSHARNVNSNIVQARKGRNIETEKFIFYRGLGRFQPQIGIQSRGERVTFSAFRKEDVPPAAMLIHVNEQGHAQMLDVGQIKVEKPTGISGATIRQLQDHVTGESNTIMSGERLLGTLNKYLLNAGLYSDEAAAMINTWKNGYFKVPGLRLLYILPRGEVDRILPVTIKPAPGNFERAFIGRIEILLESEEQRILIDVLAQREHFQVKSLGRFAEPMLRRVAEVYLSSASGNSRKPDPTILETFNRLISRAAQLEIP